MYWGGQTKFNDFKKNINEHTFYIIILFITCFVTIVYFCSKISIKNNKKFIGGESNIMNDISNTKNVLLKKLDEILDFILEYINNNCVIFLVHSKLGGSMID